MSAAYVDASAVAKLVLAEPESSALRSWLRGRAVASSSLVRVEVMRAARSHGSGPVALAQRILRRVELFGVSKLVLDRASSIAPLQLRTLDALHLATAQLASNDVGVLVTYDRRLSGAATALGIRTVSPGAATPA